MGYVFGEILPWILGALALGFVIGWLFWRCWLWRLPQDRGESTAARLTGQIGGLEQANDRLQAEVETLRARVADCAAAQAEAETLRAKVAGLASVQAEATAEADALRAKVAGLASAQAEAASLRAEVAELSARPAAATAVAAPLRGSPSAPAVAAPLVGSAPVAVAPVAAPVLDLTAAASVLGSRIKLDDLTVVEGIGPQIAGLLKAAGIPTWRALADARIPMLQEVLDKAGSRFRIHDPGTWPAQARLLASGAWAEFKALTDSLKGGRR